MLIMCGQRIRRLNDLIKTWVCKNVAEKMTWDKMYIFLMKIRNILNDWAEVLAQEVNIFEQMKIFIWGVTWNACFQRQKTWHFCNFLLHIAALQHNFRVVWLLWCNFRSFYDFFRFKILKNSMLFRFQNQANFEEFCNTPKIFFLIL